MMMMMMIVQYTHQPGHASGKGFKDDDECIGNIAKFDPHHPQTP